MQKLEQWKGVSSWCSSSEIVNLTHNKEDQKLYYIEYVHKNIFKSKQTWRHNDDPKHHFPRMKDCDNDEDHQHGEEVVCLVVQEVVVDSVGPFVNIIEVGSLKSWFGKYELI